MVQPDPASTPPEDERVHPTDDRSGQREADRGREPSSFTTTEEPPPAPVLGPADTAPTPQTWWRLPDAGQFAGLIAVAVLAYGVVLIISSLRTILVMLLVSLFIAFAMEPAVQYLGRRWGWRRGVATAVVFAVTLLAAVAAFGSVIPLLVDQVSALLRSVPTSTAELNELIAQLPFVNVELDPGSELSQELQELSQDLSDRLQDGLTAMAGNLLGAAGNVVSLGRTALGLFFQGLTVLLLSFYLVADGPRFRATLARPLPQHRQRELLAVWEIAVAKTGGYIYSRVLLAGLATSMTAAFLAVLGLPYALPIGLWVGITGAFIPVVGTYLGGVLAILVALTTDPIKALWVLGFIAVYQQVENYLLAPRLQAATMDVHPAVAFLSVLIGGTLLGAVGALLALPATAIIQAVGSTYLHRNELIDELMEVSSRLETQVPELGGGGGARKPVVP